METGKGSLVRLGIYSSWVTHTVPLADVAFNRSEVAIPSGGQYFLRFIKTIVIRCLLFIIIILDVLAFTLTPLLTYDKHESLGNSYSGMPP